MEGEAQADATPKRHGKHMITFRGFYEGGHTKLFHGSVSKRDPEAKKP